MGGGGGGGTVSSQDSWLICDATEAWNRLERFDIGGRGGGGGGAPPPITGAVDEKLLGGIKLIGLKDGAPFKNYLLKSGGFSI